MSSKEINLKLDSKSIQNAINQVKMLKTEYIDKANILVMRLSRIGIQTIDMIISEIDHPDPTVKSSFSTKTSILSDKSGHVRGVEIELESKHVLFIEFSAGFTYGTNDYPLKVGENYGVGTYPEQKHAYSEHGWFYNNEDGDKIHSYGNKAYMPMYNAEIEIIKQVRQIIYEVFR